MFRISIRELLLLTCLVGVAVAWRVEIRAHEMTRDKLAATRSHAEELRESLQWAKGMNGMLRDAIDHPDEPQCWQVPHPNWALISQPIP